MYFPKNKIVRAVLGLILAAGILAAVSKLGENPVSRAVNSALSPVYNMAYSAVTPVRRYCAYIAKAPEYEKRINELESRVNTLKIENKTRADYIAENKRLKELLDLKEEFAGNKTVAARVISYEPNSWYDTVMLNRGSSNGIKKNDTVITDLGVVGKVMEVGKNWSKVSTVLNIKNSVGVKLARTEDIGVVSGDAALAENKNCRLEYMSNDKALIKGDILVTSGLGGIYPAGLTVGKVTEVKSDSAGNLEYGVVEPSVDFSSLYEVLVITYEDGQGAEE